MSPSPFELPAIGALADLLPAFDFEYLIAKGGTGAVYKARQRSLDRDIAIKIFPRELGADPLFHGSFQAGAKAMARLTHPNLIRVYDSGEVDGLFYMVMEYVPGKSLYRSAHGKVIDPKQAVEIVIAACQGIAHAHENGIVHRDIKPANILLTPECAPKIGDFGLARCTRSEAEGLPMGTPAYMAPEIVNNPETGDRQSDVFAIGVLLRELLTGVPAGTEGSAKAVVADLKLAAICRQATHADPAMRHPDATSLADQLTRWMAPEQSRPLMATRHPISLKPKPSKTYTAPSAGWALLKNCALIAVLLCAIGLLWGVYQTKQETVALLQQEEDAKPKVIFVHADSRTVANNSPSREVRTALAAGRFE